MDFCVSLWFFFLRFFGARKILQDFFLKFLFGFLENFWIIFKVTKVTTKRYGGDYWTSKMAFKKQNNVKSSLLSEGQNCLWRRPKPSAGARSKPAYRAVPSSLKTERYFCCIFLGGGHILAFPMKIQWLISCYTNLLIHFIVNLHLIWLICWARNMPVFFSFLLEIKPKPWDWVGAILRVQRQK